MSVNSRFCRYEITHSWYSVMNRNEFYAADRVQWTKNLFFSRVSKCLCRKPFISVCTFRAEDHEVLDLFRGGMERQQRYKSFKLFVNVENSCLANVAVLSSRRINWRSVMSTQTNEIRRNRAVYIASVSSPEAFRELVLHGYAYNTHRYDGFTLCWNTEQLAWRRKRIYNHHASRFSRIPYI